MPAGSLTNTVNSCNAAMAPKHSSWRRLEHFNKQNEVISKAFHSKITEAEPKHMNTYDGCLELCFIGLAPETVCEISVRLVSK